MKHGLGQPIANLRYFGGHRPPLQADLPRFEPDGQELGAPRPDGLRIDGTTAFL